jgi:hypothetical protein
MYECDFRARKDRSAGHGLGHTDIGSIVLRIKQIIYVQVSASDLPNNN